MNFNLDKILRGIAITVIVVLFLTIWTLIMSPIIYPYLIAGIQWIKIRMIFLGQVWTLAGY